MAEDNTSNKSNHDLPPSNAMFSNDNPSFDSPFDPSKLISQTRIASPRQASVVPHGAGFAQDVNSTQQTAAQLAQIMNNSDRIAVELKAKGDAEAQVKVDAGETGSDGGQGEDEDEDSGSEDETTVSIQGDDDAAVHHKDNNEGEQNEAKVAEANAERPLTNPCEPAHKIDEENDALHDEHTTLDAVADRFASIALSDGIPPSWANRQRPVIFQDGLWRLEHHYDRYYDTTRAISNWLNYRPPVPRSDVPSWTSIYEPPGTEDGVYRRHGREQKLLDELVASDADAAGTPSAPGLEYGNPAVPPSAHIPELKIPGTPVRAAVPQFTQPVTHTGGVVLPGAGPSATICCHCVAQGRCADSGGVRLTAEEAMTDNSGLSHEIEEADCDASRPWT